MEGFLINNPFVVGKYLSDKYFCDRDSDTEFLKKQIVNGRNVALISPRRIGKSGLIQHFFNQPDIQETYHVFYVDIYATTSLGNVSCVLRGYLCDDIFRRICLYPWKRNLRAVKASIYCLEREVFPLKSA